jgi:hypothetical protein
MKHLYSLLSLWLLFVPIANGQSALRTLVRSFNVEGKTAVAFDLVGKMEIKVWENAFVRVQMSVGLPHNTDNTLKSLVESGRYDISSKTEGSTLIVVAPQLASPVSIQNKPLIESIGYTVFVPKRLAVKQSL